MVHYMKSMQAYKVKCCVSQIDSIIVGVARDPRQEGVVSTVTSYVLLYVILIFFLKEYNPNIFVSWIYPDSFLKNTF